MNPLVCRRWAVYFLYLSAVSSVRPAEDTGSQRNSFVELSERAAFHKTRAGAQAGAGSEEESTKRLDANVIAAEGDVDVRPDADKGPTVVKFGITFRTLYGMDIAEGTYTADIVLSFGWKDDRTKSLANDGKPMTLSEDSAEKKLWMPGMVVSNRNLAGVEVLSTAVTVDGKGGVTKVQRVLAVMKNKFIVKNYPFDSQDLIVITSSAKYMLEDVKIEAFDSGEQMASQVKDDAFDGKDVKFVSFKAEAFEEISGPLRKSRGRIIVNVHRDCGKFLKGLLSPLIFLLVMSYMVFWFPLMGPFVMPRLATSVITFMALMQTSSKYDAMIAGAGASWGDVYLQSFSTLIFLTVIVNVALEYVSHQLKATELAQTMNTEMKKLYPAVALVTLLECSILAWGGMITALTIMTAYGFHCYRRLVMQSIIDPKDLWPFEESPPEGKEDEVQEDNQAEPPAADSTGAQNRQSRAARLSAAAPVASSSGDK